MKKKPDGSLTTLKQAIDRRLKSLTNGRAGNQGPARENPPATEGADKPPRVASRRHLWVFLLLCLAGSSLASYVVFKYIAPAVVAPSIPPELVGTWQVMEGDMQGATLEFSWYGAATAILFKQGKRQTTNSTAKVVGKVLFLTTEDAVTGTHETVTQTILQLTPEELVLRDEDRNVYQMKRVRN
jgi:uncharacterized protein (TIGR03066 family)